MADDFEVGGLLPEETSNNRTFVIAAVGLAALLICSIVGLAAYALVLAPKQQAARETEAAEIVLQNTHVAGTQTAEVSGVTEEAGTEAVTATPSPTITPTQVVVLPTNTPTESLTESTLAPQTATAAAQATLDAAGGGGGGTPTATALPVTGFADEVGIPALAMLAGVLLVVIFITRGVRTRAEAQD